MVKGVKAGMGACALWVACATGAVAVQDAEAAPTVFGEGAVSQPDRYEFRVSIAPDGQSLMYSYFERPRLYGIGAADRVDGVWQTRPDPAFLADWAEDAVLEPAYALDGSALVFNANRDAGARNAFDLWMVPIVDGETGVPRRLAEPINSAASEWYPSLVRNGALYFGSEREGGDIDLYRALDPFSDTPVIERLPDAINTDSNDYDAYVDPDERFMIFISDRPGGLGRTDLYIALPDEAGRFTRVHHVGAPYNDEAEAGGSPMVTPDTRHLLTAGGLGTGGPGDIVQLPLDLFFAAAGLDLEVVLAGPAE